jgi:hypothetical protein
MIVHQPMILKARETPNIEDGMKELNDLADELVEGSFMFADKMIAYSKKTSKRKT